MDSGSCSFSPFGSHVLQEGWLRLNSVLVWTHYVTVAFCHFLYCRAGSWILRVAWEYEGWVFEDGSVSLVLGIPLLESEVPDRTQISEMHLKTYLSGSRGLAFGF